MFLSKWAMVLSFGNTLKHKTKGITGYCGVVIVSFGHISKHKNASMPRDISHSGGALDNNYLKKYI